MKAITSGEDTGPEHVRGLNFLYFLEIILIRKFKNLNRVRSGLLDKWRFLTAGKFLEALISFFFWFRFLFSLLRKRKKKENEHKMTQLSN